MTKNSFFIISSFQGPCIFHAHKEDSHQPAHDQSLLCSHRGLSDFSHATAQLIDIQCCCLYKLIIVLAKLAIGHTNADEALYKGTDICFWHFASEVPFEDILDIKD